MEGTVAPVQVSGGPEWVQRWLADFAPYSAQHVATLAIFGSAMAVGMMVGLRWRGTPKERAWRVAWGVTAVVTQGVELAWWCRPGQFDPETSLPLAMCDLMAWVASMWLLSKDGSRVQHVLAVVMYYCGLCLSSQAFLTPILREGEGMGTLRYWFFWIGHTHIVGAALYGLIVSRFRPGWRECGIAILAGMGYVVVAVTANLLIGGEANYGFLGNKEVQPAVVKLAGPYPWKILWMGVVVTLLFILATVPWVVMRRWKDAAASRQMCQ